MKSSVLLSTLSALLFSTGSSSAQAPGNVDVIAPSPPVKYVKPKPIDIKSISGESLNSASAQTFIYPGGGRDSSAIFTSRKTGAGGTGGTIPKNDGDQDDEAKGGNITGLVTVPTFAGAFAAQGSEDTGVVFPYIMVGNHPFRGDTTTIPAKISTVSVQLLNANGSVRMTIPFAPFEELTLNSPNFRDANYTSGHHIQFGDAVQRAEFFNMMKEDWHTRLDPSVVNRVTIQIPRFANVQLPNGQTIKVQAYFVGKAPDGSAFVEVLDLLFLALDSNLAINDIANQNFQTFAENVHLYPNTFLFSIDDQGHRVPGLTLGFHTYFYDPSATPQPRWLFSFASWISPGLFSGGPSDVTALSHEISETLNDPFDDNIVPVWQFPGVSATAQICDDTLETGDPLEDAANATFPVLINVNGAPFKFHPQNEALLQWFEMGKTSNALGGAFSYPNTKLLPDSALPCPSGP
jgi:hypothetical protein